MESLKRLIGGLAVVSAAILVVLVAGRPAVAARASAASAIDSGSSGKSTSTACCTSPSPSPSPPDSPSPSPPDSPSPSPSPSPPDSPSPSPSPSPPDSPSPSPPDSPSPSPSPSPPDSPSPSPPDSPSPGTSTPTSTPGSKPGSTPGGTPSTGEGVPIVLVSGTGGGLSLAVLLVLWAFTSHARKVRRQVRWVKEHLRAVAGSSPDLPSAEIRPRPGTRSVSLGLEPHDDHLGNQKNKED